MKRTKKKRQLKRRVRILLLISSIIFIIGMSSFVGFSYVRTLSPKNGYGKKSSSGLNAQYLMSLQISQEQSTKLEDYQFVYEMLDMQDISSYPEALKQTIAALKLSVKENIANQETGELEQQMNQLAAAIDRGLFTQEGKELYYASGILIMNKQHCADTAFAPGKRSSMNQALKDLISAAKEEGVYLSDFSDYRSYYTQEGLYNRYVAADGEEEANRYSAKPGCSEHQSGYAVDIGGADKSKWAETTFDTTQEAQWLEQNAPTYGFVKRYLPDKEEITGYIHESWHYRYVGKIAPKIQQSGKTIEEYFGIT